METLFSLSEYDNVIYTNIDECRNACLDAQEQFPDRSFEIYEVEIK